MKPHQNTVGFPTVLLAELDEAVSASLSGRLRKAGYNVLKADDWARTILFVRTHSRPIHFLLTNTDRARPGAIESLKPYRPKMEVVFISDDRKESLSSVSESVLVRLLRLLRYLKRP